jgi:AcrR family transcriptional regulator
MNSDLGRRDRKKAATRAALSAAAMKLATENGVDHVTAEMIANAADVAPRTFHNYFSSKEEAIVASMLDKAQSFADLLRARPAEEPMWDALRAAVWTLLDMHETQIEQLSCHVHLINSNPSLLPHAAAAFAEADRALATAIADRTGTDIDHDMYPRLQAAAAVAAMKTAMYLWTEGLTTAASLPDLAVEALDKMRAGVPEPVRNPH